MTARGVSALLAGALALYLVVLGERAVILLEQPRLALRGLGVAVILVGLVGGYLLVAEIRFGLATQRLARHLPPEQAPGPPRSAGGRPDRAAADARFAARRDQVEAAPGDWRAWYLLGVAYGEAGDRRRGRAAVRHAIDLFRATGAPAGPESG